MQAAEKALERRVVRWTGFPRSTIRYRSERPAQEGLRARIRELAGERPRWGYRRLSLRDARHTIERWRQDYNRVRPHSALGDLPPADFALNHHMESVLAARENFPLLGVNP